VQPLSLSIGSLELRLDSDKESPPPAAVRGRFTLSNHIID